MKPIFKVHELYFHPVMLENFVFIKAVICLAFVCPASLLLTQKPLLISSCCCTVGGSGHIISAFLHSCPLVNPFHITLPSPGFSYKQIRKRGSSLCVCKDSGENENERRVDFSVDPTVTNWRGTLLSFLSESG